MIDLPKYIRIGCHVVKVRRLPGLVTTQDAFGMWDDGKLEITIDAELKGTLLWETFWHETQEAINTLLDEQRAHAFIQSSGLLTAQIFLSLFEQKQKEAV